MPGLPSLGKIDFTGSHYAHKEPQSSDLLPNPRKWNRVFAFVQTKIRQGVPPQYIPWAPRFLDIFNNKIGLENSDQWFPDRPLGRGSFGAVALYHQKDIRGNVVDVRWPPF